MAAPPRSDDNLHYLHVPDREFPVAMPIEFVGVQDFLTDEAASRVLWDLVASQFRSRHKFLAVWRCVSWVALHRGPAGEMDGCLLVSAPINWQIDYVVVAPQARGQGIGAALVKATLNQALARRVPYVMLSSRPELRPLYEGECGFRVVHPGPIGPAAKA
jgi:ribosomal protein S18 acetylase RimI-like enzyme